MDSATEGAKRPPRVLIVDDDPSVVKFLRDRCTKTGLEVREASNGLQALIMARRDPPDVLIIDVHTPELDGLSVCSTLLGPGRKPINVIVVSGLMEAETCERVESFGGSFVQKGSDLWKSVREALGRCLPGVEFEIEPPQSALVAPPREQPLVLVIEDDENVGNFIASRLRNWRVDAILAPDGRRGYQIAVREHPSLVISDCFMAGADINFFLWRLRTTPGFERTPVLAMTGYELEKPAEENLLKGPFGLRGVEQIFKKPLDINLLFAACQKYCVLKYQPATDRRHGAESVSPGGGGRSMAGI
jgi:CheY-like chemotaxis protein